MQLVTPVYGSTSVYENHNIDEWYSPFTSTWITDIQDKAAMPSGAIFNGAMWDSLYPGGFDATPAGQVPGWPALASKRASAAMLVGQAC